VLGPAFLFVGPRKEPSVKSGKQTAWLTEGKVAPRREQRRAAVDCSLPRQRNAIRGNSKGRVESELLRNLSELLFQPVTIGDVHPVKLLELVEQLLRRSRVVTVTFPLGDDLALVGNMPLSFGNVPPSQRQMVQYQGSVWHTSSNARQVRPFRPREPAGALAERMAASFVTAKIVNPAAGSGLLLVR
jgi:hypothetical protein